MDDVPESRKSSLKSPRSSLEKDNEALTKKPPSPTQEALDESGQVKKPGKSSLKSPRSSLEKDYEALTKKPPSPTLEVSDESGHHVEPDGDDETAPIDRKKSKKQVKLSLGDAVDTPTPIQEKKKTSAQEDRKKSYVEKRLSRRKSSWGGAAQKFVGMKERKSEDELAEFDESAVQSQSRFSNPVPATTPESSDHESEKSEHSGGGGHRVEGSRHSRLEVEEEWEGEGTDHAFRRSMERKKKSSTHQELVPEEYKSEHDDFNQQALQAQKAADDEVRARRGSWGADLDEGESPAEEGEEDDDVGGGMQGLLGRSEAAKEELAAKEQKEQENKKRKRKRRQSVTKGKDKEKKDKAKKKKAPEEEVKEKEKVEEVKVWVEPHYITEDYVSPPLQTEDSIVPDDIIKFFESYGYDSERRDNLQMIDEDTLIFISGNYLHFYSIKDRKVKQIQRAAVGYGLGHVAVHPTRNYYAVGEKGLNPIIAVYTWPKRDVYRILKRGTTKGYAFVNFNHEGEYLCSQGMDPDYMLTIWDWEHEKILLRYKSYSQDIFRATFNPSNPGDLVTCGVGHIRFWRMAETFTGLKLQGAIGRFGKTEISDIEDYIALSDGKVLSGSEWGNVLVWDGGLIVCEIRKNEGITMHEGEIMSLCLMDTGELLTVGTDGCIKMWDAETIDVADTIVGDSGIFEVEPIHELKLATDAKLLGVLKNMGADPAHSMWFLQDAWGRIWDTDLTASMASTEYTASSVFYCPGGGINALAVSPRYSVMVVGTSRGHLWLIEYINKQWLAKKHYSDAITKLLWLPTQYDDDRGVTFLVGFADGHIRNFSIQPTTPEQKDEDAEDPFTKDQPYEFSLNQILRFAKGAITVLKLDEANDILYICGEDRSLWACSVYFDDMEECPVLEPLAYYTAPFPVAHLDLHPTKDYRMIIASKSGRVAECRKPQWLELDSHLTFNQGKLHGRRWWYKSVKCVRRKLERKEARKIERERRLALLKEDIMKRKEAGINVEPEIEMGRLNEEFRKAQNADDEDPIYIPEKPCPVLGVYYHINNKIAEPGAGKTFYMQVGDYDAGYIYECKCTKPEVGGFHPVPPTPPLHHDVGIRSYIVSKDDAFLLFGMDDGSIRVMPRVDVNKKREELRKKAEIKKKQDAKDRGGEEDEEQDDEDEDEDGGAGEYMAAAQKKAAEKKAEAERKKKAESFQISIFPYDVENFFALPMHDPNRGAVNALAWSHDGQFLFSVGSDGSIFSYRWDPKNKLHHVTDALPKASLPDEILPGDFLLDSEEPNAYTVEEMRAKEEEDRLYGMSEQAKEDVRSQLREMKAIYRSIRQRNTEIPEQFRLPEEKLKLPGEIYAHIYKKIEEECDEVYRIHEYESAETMIQLDKISKFYFDPVETSHVVVKDISHVLQVHTIRNRKVTKQFEDLIDKNKEIMEEEKRIMREQGNKAEEEVKQLVQPVQRIWAKDIIGEYESKLHTYDVETVHNIRRLERRLSQRYDREVAWQELMSKKINPDYIPPEDQKALDDAKAETGAFRLQNSENYLGEQISVAERRQRIIDMKIQLRERIAEFNTMVIEARNEKPRVLAECRRLEKEIKKIHVLLPEEYRRKIPPIFDMELDETPEAIMDITQEQVEAEETSMLEAAGLLSIKEDILEEFFGVKKPEKSMMIEDEDNKPVFVPPPPATAARQAKAIDLENESVASHRCRKCYFTPQSELEKKRFEVQFYPTLYRQEMLFKDLLRIIKYFYERVKFIHDTRVQLEIDTKVKAIGLLTMICELDIAKEFDAQEKAIMERLRAQQAECKDAKHHMDKIKKKLVKVNTDVKKFETEVQVITKEVENIIGGKGRYSDYLWRVFKKKIKIEIGEEEEHAEMRRHLSTSSESTESSESTSQDSGSDLFKMPKQRMDINTCPEHLDRNIYNKICELRQKKATLEQEIDLEKRIADKINHEYVEIEKVYVKYEGRLTDISEEIRVLQRRRQKRMNDLKLMVILRADQIQCMDMDDVADMDGDILDKLAQTFPGANSCIIFPNGGTDSLDKRSAELMKKAKEEKELYKAGKKMLVRLKEELKKSEKQVDDIQALVEKEMVLKFGQKVDLDKITAVIINLELLDQEILLDKMKNAQYKERQKVNEELSDVRYKLTGKIKENSKFNMLKAMMLERRRDVDYYIWKNEKGLDTKSVLDVKTDENGDMASKIEDIMHMSDTLYAQSVVSDSNAKDNLEADIIKTRTVLKRQNDRIKELKDVLRRCRLKAGLPPLIPICQRVEQTSSQSRVQSQKQPPESYVQERMQKSPYYGRKEKKVVPTAKEMAVLNQYCPPEGIQCGVQTIYKGHMTSDLTKSGSHTLLGMEDVDKAALERTSKIFNDPSEINYDYDSGDEDVGGAAAMRDFQETIGRFLPDEEEEFMQYLEEGGIHDLESMQDIGEDRHVRVNTPDSEQAPKSENSGSANSGSSGIKQRDPNSHVRIYEPRPSDTGEESEESKALRKKRANRKSVIVLAEAAKVATESQVLTKIRRMSMGTALSNQERDALEDFEALQDQEARVINEKRKSMSAAEAVRKSIAPAGMNRKSLASNLSGQMRDSGSSKLRDSERDSGEGQIMDSASGKLRDSGEGQTRASASGKIRESGSAQITKKVTLQNMDVPKDQND